jgi:hypothetical protein
MSIEYSIRMRDSTALTCALLAAILSLAVILALAIFLPLVMSGRPSVLATVSGFWDASIMLLKCNPSAPCASDGLAFMIHLSRIIFILGLSVSVVGQVCVEKYFKLTGLIEFTRADSRTLEFVENYISWDKIFLGMALFSLCTLDNPAMHMAFSFSYLLLIAFVDYVYANKISDNDAARAYFIRNPSSALKRFAIDLWWTIDIPVIIPMLLSLVGAGLLYYEGARYLGNQVAWDKVAEIFMSGALGFQLAATVILLCRLLLQWDRQMRASWTFSQRAQILQAVSECPGAYCWLLAIRSEAERQGMDHGQQVRSTIASVDSR